MKQELHTQVLIIGGGPAGMVSALYLDKLGIDNILVERQFEISQHPKAHELSARSLEILEQLGLSLEELKQEASPYDDASKILFCHTIKEELGRIDLQKGGNDEKYKTHLAANEPYLNLSQTELERILRKKIATCSHTQLMTGVQWQSMEESTEEVVSTILHRTNEELFSIHSKYVICADGAGSRSRKALGIQMIGEEKLQDFLSVYFELNLRDYVDTPAKLYWIMHPKAPGTFIAHHIERRWVYHFPIFTEYEDKESYTEEILKERIYTALGTRDIPLDIHSISLWRMTLQIAESFSRGRCYLVGDSAHRFPPTGGLGMNSGIGDAQNICWKLAFVLRGLASPKLLESYEVERRPVIEKNSEESYRNYLKIYEVPESLGLNPNALHMQAKLLNSTFFKLIPNSLSSFLLEKLYGFLSKKILSIHSKPQFKQKVTQAIQDQVEHFDRIGLDLGYAYDTGALGFADPPEPIPAQKVSEYVPSLVIGARFPHFWMEEGDQKINSHQLLNSSKFTVLCNHQGKEWWTKQVEKLPKDLLGAIELIQLSSEQLASTDIPIIREELLQKSLLILMIRPDGQIAWKIHDTARLFNPDISSLFTQILP